MVFLRPANGAFEVLLQRRHARQSVMGGVLVFPGGKVDAWDADPDVSAFTPNFSPALARAAMSGAGLSEDEAMAYFMAAIRETFEEAGLLFAYGPNGEDPDHLPAVLLERLPEYRTLVHEGKVGLVEMAGRENIRFAPELLVPYSRWVTPSFEKKRFDTLFFLARAPVGQQALHDQVEMVETVWIEPDEAERQTRSGRMLLMPPTLKTVAELAERHGVACALEEAASRDLAPIMPEMFREGERLLVRLPHDPEYSIPEYKAEDRPDEPSRMALTPDGRWVMLPALSSP